MNKLKALRAAKGLTIKELAEKADIDPATISMIENNRRRAQAITLNKLANFFAVPVEDLAELADTTAAERGSKGGQTTKARRQIKPKSSDDK